MKKTLLALVLLASWLNAKSSSHSRLGCATLLINTPNKSGVLYKRALFKQSANTVYTHYTTHFAIHYTTSGEHAVKTPIVPPNTIPPYIDTLANYLEQAWSYYIGNLKMRVPPTPTFSAFHRAANKGKYPVEVLDINLTDSLFFGEIIYGVTTLQGIQMENDFLYTKKNGTQDSITASYEQVFPPRVINYAKSWNLGLKVTTFHEFYHSIQLGYAPLTQNPHVWYEASAVGMEERLAPEINDYLQYLGQTLNSFESLGMFETEGAEIATYGKGVFHQYLSETLGYDFDVLMWTRLSSSNNLTNAFRNVFIQKNVDSSVVLGKFSEILARQKTEDSNVFSVFNSDWNIWPTMPFTSLDFSKSNFSNFVIPAFGFRKILFAPNLKSTKLQVELLKGTRVRLQLLEKNKEVQSLDLNNQTNKIAAITLPADPTSFAIVLANPNFRDSSQTRITLGAELEDPTVLAYPNPLVIGEHFPQFQFSKTPTSPDTKVEILSEWGQKLATLNFPASEKSWKWDLPDNLKRKSSGPLYYRVNNGKWRVMYISRGLTP